MYFYPHQMNWLTILKYINYSNNHIQIHFSIKVKSQCTNIKHCRRNSHKRKYKDTMAYLAKIDWNKILKNHKMQS